MLKSDDASCQTALKGSCSTDAAKAHSPFASEPCAVCCGHLQHALRAAHCTHADITAYCANHSIPVMMTAVQKTGSCSTPFDCVQSRRVPVPAPGKEQALLRVASSSVNPCDADYVEGSFGGCSGGGGTLGSDVAGTVVKAGAGCRLKTGDRVWADENGFTGTDTGGMAEYAVVQCAQAGIAPTSINLTAAGTIPLAGLTSVEAMQALGAPWTAANLTVVVTSGTGGTGYLGVQLAKAFGAARVVTATSGAANIALARSFGADIVIDYKVQDIFSALPDDSVDLVYDNYGAAGTADRAMPKIKVGGTYLIVPGGEGGRVSAHPRAGIHQLTFRGTASLTHAGLDVLAAQFDRTDALRLRPRLYAQVPLAEAKRAYALSATGDVVGKVAVVAGGG